MQVVVSEVEAGDIATIHEIVLINDIFAEESAHYSIMGYNRDKFGNVVAEFTSDTQRCAVAHVDGKLVAYAPYMLDTLYLDKINLEIMTFYVAPEYRNSGVGGVLADYLVESIFRHGASYAQIAICANFKHNRDLIQRATERLFKQRGFEQIGTVLGRRGI